jgi:succinate dehydrogenase/fumarate reductase flavoprotein subunit
MEAIPEAVDVVVVGGGMSGLVAAAAAQEDGATVLLLEKGPEPGGSLALSGGYIWTLPSFESYEEICPLGDPILGRLVIEDFATGIDWLKDHGARLGPSIEGFGEDGVGIGHRLEPDSVSAGVAPLARAFTAAGGRLHIRAPVLALESSPGQGVTHVVCRDVNGAVRRVRARSVVVATGGFQGDVELVTRYITPWADRLHLRSNPYSTGDGLRFALAAGASASRGLSAFYGHLLPAPPARIEPASFRVLAQLYSPHAVLLNREGRRFVDESRGDAVSALALSRQPEAAGFLVFDADCHRDHVVASHLPDMPAADPLQVIGSSGGAVLQAGSLDELGRQLSRLGCAGASVAATLRSYNHAVAELTPEELDPPRRGNLHRCSRAPFTAVPVRPGITFTEGGVRVDETCQALDRDGRPVPGLFVAGVDVGGFSNEGYAGGLAAALVTGLRAGVHAARYQAA